MFGNSRYPSRIRKLLELAGCSAGSAAPDKRRRKNSERVIAGSDAEKNTADGPNPSPCPSVDEAEFQSFSSMLKTTCPGYAKRQQGKRKGRKLAGNETVVDSRMEQDKSDDNAAPPPSVVDSAKKHNTADGNVGLSHSENKIDPVPLPPEIFISPTRQHAMIDEEETIVDSGMEQEKSDDNAAPPPSFVDSAIKHNTADDNVGLAHSENKVDPVPLPPEIFISPTRQHAMIDEEETIVDSGMEQDKSDDNAAPPPSFVDSAIKHNSADGNVGLAHSENKVDPVPLPPEIFISPTRQYVIIDEEETIVDSGIEHDKSDDNVASPHSGNEVVSEFVGSPGRLIIYSVSDDGCLVPVQPSPTVSESPLADQLMMTPCVSPRTQLAVSPLSTLQMPGRTEEGRPVRRSLFEDDPTNQKRKRQNQGAIQPRARKRQSYPNSWKAVAAKTAKHAGLEYTSVKSGKVFPKKVLGPPCKEDCKFHCRSNITEEQRQEVFSKFYCSPNQEKKWDFISRLLVIEKPLRPAEDTISGRNRTSTIHYHLRVNGENVKVCRTLFLNTLQISEQVVKTVVKKLGPSCGTSPDKRGANKPANRIPEETRQSVINHIDAFPRVASHFCRADSTCEYLEEEVKSIANMFRLYVPWAKENNITKPASYRQYLDIFNNTPGINIRIFQSKKDQCDVCYAFNQKTPDEKAQSQAEYDEHRRRKEVPRLLKKEDSLKASTSPLFCAAVFDLQKVLFTPKCKAGILYYHRKFSNYNFTVWDIGKKEGHCYVWNEVIGKRGSNEVASFVLDFIEKKNKSGTKVFHFYADNCAGQNKNRMIYAMLMHAAAKYNVDIILRFLMTGHTQNEGDSLHACIENHCANTDMFVSADWWENMKTSKKDGKLFIVNEVSQENIFDFHDFVQTKSEWKKNTLEEEVPWSKLEELQFSGAEQGMIRYKIEMDCSDDLVREVNTKVKRRGHPVNIATFKFPQVYKAPLSISAKKKEDLVMYCNRGIIPTKHHDFYRSMKVSNVNDRDEFYCQKLRGQKE